MVHPLLMLLVRSLFTFASKLDVSISNDTLKQILDAMSSVFSNYPELRKSMLDLILLHQSDQFSINMYFYSTTMEYEA